MDNFFRLTLKTSLALAIAVLNLALFLVTAQSKITDFNEMIARIRSETSGAAREQKAQDLAQRILQIVDEGQSDAISDDTIDVMTDLLRDDNQEEDFWIVGALGYIGGRAGRAVPALEMAYARACADRFRPNELRSVILFGIQSTDVIAYALARITERTPDCRGWRRHHL